MIEKVVSNFADFNELGIVKKISESSFVQHKIRSFEILLHRTIIKNAGKVVNPIAKKQKVLNIILVNLIVFAFFAGKASVHDIIDWSELYGNYKIIGVYALIVNSIGAVLFGLGKIIRYTVKLTLKVFIIFFVVTLVYIFFSKIYSFFTKKDDSDSLLEVIKEK